MRLSEAIIVRGAVETDVAVINDIVEEKKCPKCGQMITVAGGITLSSVLNIQAGSESAACPHCSATIKS